MADTRPALPRPDWATDTTYTSGPDNTLVTKIQPLSGEVAQGYFRTGRVPARKLNWQLNKIGAWITWLADNTINAEAGGAYNPDNPIIIDGHGLHVRGANTFQVSSDATLFDGLDVEFQGSGVIFGASTPVLFNGNQTTVGTSHFEGVSTFDAQPHFNAGILVALPGVAISDSGAVIGNGIPGVVITSVIQATNEIVLSGGGRIRKRQTYAPDLNASFDITTTDRLIVGLSVTATRTYTLGSAGASEGSEVEVLNYTANAMTVQLPASAPSVPAVSSGQPGRLRFVWADATVGGAKWHLA